MKVIFALCGAILIGAGIWIWNSTRLPNHYGTFSGAPKVEVSVLIEKPQDYLHKYISIDGVVAKQCTTMGCYFFFESGGKLLRVDIADIAMNAPRRNGHVAHVEGQMVPYNDGYQFSATAVEFK